MNDNQKDTPAAKSYLGYAQDTIIIAVALVTVALFQFLRLSILTKSLGAELYGIWSIIWVTVILTTSLATLNLNTAMVRFLAAEKDISKIRQEFLSVIIIVLGVGLLCSLGLVLCSGFIATTFLGDINVAPLIRLSALMILSQALSQMGLAYFWTFRQMKWYAGLLAGKAAVELALMVCFLMLGWELTGLVIAVLASDVLCIAITFFISLRRVGFQRPGFAHIGNYLKYGLPLVPANALLWVIQFSNPYILGYYMQTKDVGIYAAAYSLTGVIWLMLGPLQVVLLPAISKSHDAGDIAMTRSYLRYSFKYLMMLSIPAAFGLSVLAAPLLYILTTPEFIAGSAVVPFLALGLIFYGIYQVCLHIFLLSKKTYLILIILGISAAVNICLNLVLVPAIGILGAAVATLIAYLALGVLATVLSSRYFIFDMGLPFILKSIFASAIMAAGIWLVMPSDPIQVIASIIAGMIVYFVILIGLRGLSKEELNLFKELILKFKSSGQK